VGAEVVVAGRALMPHLALLLLTSVSRTATRAPTRPSVLRLITASNASPASAHRTVLGALILALACLSNAHRSVVATTILAGNRSALRLTLANLDVPAGSALRRGSQAEPVLGV